jgi:hypothetical protein
MKLTIFSDYSDNEGETKEFLYRSQTAEGIMESHLLEDEVEVLKQLHQLITTRTRLWKFPQK